MNERVPDSTGLPLRAMVMVLLFLGVIFLLVGFQAMSSGGDGADDTSLSVTSTKNAAVDPPYRPGRSYRSISVVPSETTSTARPSAVRQAPSAWRRPWGRSGWGG